MLNVSSHKHIKQWLEHTAKINAENQARKEAELNKMKTEIPAKKERAFVPPLPLPKSEDKAFDKRMSKLMQEMRQTAKDDPYVEIPEVIEIEEVPALKRDNLRPEDYDGEPVQIEEDIDEADAEVCRILCMVPR